MEKDKMILIGLIVVIVALMVAIVAMQLPQKEVTKITIKSNSTLYKGDKLVVKLMDANGTPLENKNVSVIVLDKNNKAVKDQILHTDSKGKVKMKLDLKKGKYQVEATFSGDEKYNSSSVFHKLKIIEEEVVAQETSSSQAVSSADDGVKTTAFYDDDIAGGQNVVQNEYSNGDSEHYYEDGSYDYYEASTGKTYYVTSDGEYGVDDPAAHFN